MWKCREWAKESKRKDQDRIHIETHLEGFNYQLRLILKLKSPTVSPMTMTKTILRNSLLENPKINFENLRLVCHIIGLID